MASPLVGYNTNVRHHGKVFHIQTEDSGLTHGHIFTHLFADGGRIIATKKTTYAHHIGTERYPGVVKRLMQAQHKAMFIALRDGLFDEDEVKGAKEFSAREIVLDDEKPADAKPAEPQPARAGERAGGAHASAEIATAPRSASGAATPAQPAVDAAAELATTSRDLDIAALERAAASYQEPTAADMLFDTMSTVPGSEPAPLPHASDLSPSAPKPAVAKSFSKPQAAPAKSAGPVQAPPKSSKYGTTQQAVKRPAASRPRESLFGQDLLSEKSLDEVIMSYLADDLDKE
jgi:hypothetical protein